METNPMFAAAALVGRQQAFALIASNCSSAQAQCLRQIRESRAHEQLGLTWEEFCSRHAGITRVHADSLIRRLDEFGDSYFKLSQLVRVSPDTYRQIADSVHDDTIEKQEQPHALTPWNVPRA